MPDKDNKTEFVVTDRRLFSSDGELRQDVVDDEARRAEWEQEKREAQEQANAERAAQSTNSPPLAASTIIPPEGPEPEPPPVSAAEEKASAEAYEKSTRQMDDQIKREMRKQGQAARAEDFEMSFDKFIASIYMSALMQLGLAAPQGEKPVVDLIGARQTIDTLAILQEKTKGNLTPAEANMLQNLLYEVRMAYLEVTNLLTRPPKDKPGADIKA